MPDFWEYPSVSMGLGAMTAIHQARFNRYLHHRGLRIPRYLAFGTRWAMVSLTNLSRSPNWHLLLVKDWTTSS